MLLRAQYDAAFEFFFFHVALFADVEMIYGCLEHSRTCVLCIHMYMSLPPKGINKSNLSDAGMFLFVFFVFVFFVVFL